MLSYILLYFSYITNYEFILCSLFFKSKYCFILPEILFGSKQEEKWMMDEAKKKI